MFLPVHSYCYLWMLMFSVQRQWWDMMIDDNCVLWLMLQRVPRTGWVYRNVKKPESVSDHMYRMAIMSLTITDPTVDKDRYLTTDLPYVPSLGSHSEKVQCTRNKWLVTELTFFFTVHRCMKLALVHDMAECIVGDIAPSDNISKAEKHRREEARKAAAALTHAHLRLFSFCLIVWF